MIIHLLPIFFLLRIQSTSGFVKSPSINISKLEYLPIVRHVGSVKGVGAAAATVDKSVLRPGELPGNKSNDVVECSAWYPPLKWCCRSKASVDVLIRADMFC